VKWTLITFAYSIQIIVLEFHRCPPSICLLAILKSNLTCTCWENEICKWNLLRNKMITSNCATFYTASTVFGPWMATNKPENAINFERASNEDWRVFGNLQPTIIQCFCASRISILRFQLWKFIKYYPSVRKLWNDSCWVSLRAANHFMKKLYISATDIHRPG